MTQAAEALHVTQPTLSSQIRSLERALGEDLFLRTGRSLVLTEVGRRVDEYAEEIFSLGRQLLADVEGRRTGKPVRLEVGLVDAVPKLVAYRLLEPALDSSDSVHVVCREGKLDDLLARLALHRCDVVLSDVQAGPSASVQVFHHLLGECDVTVFGVRGLAERFAGGFPESLDGAPFLLPTEGTAMRRSLDRWFETNGVSPRVTAELEDGALLKAFGQAGRGLFAIPSAISDEVTRQYGVEVVGRLEEVKERFWAITVERRIAHPVVAELSRAARSDLLGGAATSD